MQVVLLAIITIAALSYFNIDLRTIFARPEVQKIWNILVIGWVTYLKPFIVYIWTSIGVLPASPTVN